MTTAAGRHVARRKLVGRALTAFQVGNKVAGKRPLEWLAEMYNAKGEEEK